MAAILKPPRAGARGVVSFTTQERDRHINPRARDAVASLKDRWVFGLHHNWHDYEFHYDDLFDFSFAGEEDLIEADGRHVPLIPMDACNFAPAFFEPSDADKHWDVLYVARAVMFKRIPEFLQSIRQLYDQGHMLRVLFICPVPPFDAASQGTQLYDVRERYEQLFSEDEQALFNLLDLEFRFPFPFDLETLAHFYRSSRVFVHSADDERRCRVAAYAWATGLPVVSYDAVGSLLPRDLRTEPYFFRVEGDDEFAPQIERAVAASKQQPDFSPVRRLVSAPQAAEQLDRELRRIYGEYGYEYSGAPLASQQLDIRMGRHHAIGDNPNVIRQDFGRFLAYLRERSDDEIAQDLRQDDPERFIAELPGYAERPRVTLPPTASESRQTPLKKAIARARFRGGAVALKVLPKPLSDRLVKRENPR